MCNRYFHPSELYLDGAPEKMPDQLAQKALEAVAGATFEQVKTFLERKFNAAGGSYQPGREKGPRTWAWFPAVLRNHFRPNKTRPLPEGYRLSRATFEGMLKDIEIPEPIQ